MANISITTPDPAANFSRSDEVNHARLSRLLRQHPEFEHGAGADEATIRAAEACLGVKFPAAYRQFLGDFGWGFFADFEICGLGADIPEWMNVVHVTQLERSNRSTPPPEHLLPIHAEGDGDHICINVREQPGTATAVVFWDHAAGDQQSPTVLSNDFFEWLSGLL